MNNNKGFTLVEALAALVIIAIIFVVIINIFKGTFSITDSQMEKINDNRVFESAKLYVLEMNKAFNEEGYTCINLKDLVNYGYLNIDSYEDKIIKITRNMDTMVIQNVEYVSVCE